MDYLTGYYELDDVILQFSTESFDCELHITSCKNFKFLEMQGIQYDISDEGILIIQLSTVITGIGNINDFRQNYDWYFVFDINYIDEFEQF